MMEILKKNPEKSAAKININNNLIVVCITIMGIMWAVAPEKLTGQVLLQFTLAVPMLYVSCIAYTKIAYFEEIRFWDYLGWFCGTTGTALVLNFVGILVFLLGQRFLALTYFFTIWALLAIYTLINIHYNRQDLSLKLFKFLYFVLIQLVFGISIFYW